MKKIKKGFTLIELLVVIAIIAILAAILFPVFAQAREKARQTSCLSNTKQIGTALQLYTDDYDETIPFMFDASIVGVFSAEYVNKYPCGKWSNWDFYLGGAIPLAMYPYTWEDCIFPYVKNINMFICPSADKAKGGYGYNMWLIGGIEGMKQDKAGQSPLCLAGIPNSSEIVFCGDTVQFSGGASNLHKCVHVSPMYFLQWTTDTSSFIFADRHNGGGNFTFCDGHAKFYKKGQGPTAPTPDGWGQNSQYWDPNYYK
ncbi:MAG: DUF1559 domain-containing protein [Armatimonadetes bacterium]|nr:DUF1559 domain-containing protein [Candidatus Hippobium faecium]